VSPLIHQPLGLSDIEDLRSYERGRDDYRRQVIELKRRRRVAVGPFVTLLFENRETVRFQVQEMARAERMMTDEQIQGELDIYNVLLPSPTELSATMFIELTDEESLRRWLPALMGIEQSVSLRFGSGEAEADWAPAHPEAAHEEALTRPTMTASVHYLRFALSAGQVARLADGPVALVVAHPEYGHQTVLSDETRGELLADLSG
jgi:hypothetical protein